MKRFAGVVIVVIASFLSGIAISGPVAAVSLEQYLNGNIDRIGRFQWDVSASDSTSESHVATGASAGRQQALMGQLHKYMGYGSIIAAVAAGVSGSDDGFHKGAGNAAAVLAVATCVTGFAEYSHYFDLDEGLSPHNIHIILGTLATAGFVATAIDANSNDDDGHAGLGIGSTVLMAVPIVVLYF